MYTSREWDGETRLYYYRDRSVDPMLGSFYQEDPVWGNNLYTYVHNSPVRLTDPYGEWVAGIVVEATAIGIIGFSGNVAIIFDSHGSIGVVGELPVGVGLDLSVSASVFLNWDAETVDDYIKGSTITVGGAVGNVSGGATFAYDEDAVEAHMSGLVLGACSGKPVASTTVKYSSEKQRIATTLNVKKEVIEPLKKQVKLPTSKELLKWIDGFSGSIKIP